MAHDLVYFVKNDIENKELKYSLRSVEKNLPGHRVVFAGGCPYDLTPDLHLDIMQRGNLKYDRVKSMLSIVCKKREISDDFILMNDDFFIMEENPFLETYYANGTLDDLCDKVEKKYGPTLYAKNLRTTAAILKSKGYPTHNFELHVPMLINKKLMSKLLSKYRGYHGVRSIYGNICIAGKDDSLFRLTDMKDVKVHDAGATPAGDEPFLSTSDYSFAKGNVGKYIREMFPDKSRFESSLH